MVAPSPRDNVAQDKLIRRQVAAVMAKGVSQSQSGAGSQPQRAVIKGTGRGGRGNGSGRGRGGRR